jgi:hypothetical protein
VRVRGEDEEMKMRKTRRRTKRTTRRTTRVFWP